MAAPAPPKPQVVSLTDGGAIFAWLGTYPAGTTFNTYWEIGTAGTVPVVDLTNQFSVGLKARTDSLGEGRGLAAVPADINVYVSVTSFAHGVESAQSPPLFLSVCNSHHADSISVAMDESNANKMLRTDEKGRLFVVTDSSAPSVITEAPLVALAPEVIAVGTSAVLLPAVPATDRQMIVIQNQGTTSLFVGLVGSELYEVETKQTLTFTVGAGSTLSGIRLSGTGLVCVWEYTL